MLRKSLAPALWIVAAVLSGCNYASSPQPEGAVLFQDDFTLPISGWDRINQPASAIGYQDGTYRVKILAPETIAWGRPHLSFEDITLDVDATKSGGPEDNLFGVLCRYQDPANFYFFLISSDGYAGAGAYRDGERFIFGEAAMLPSPAVASGEATNHLQVDCLGSTVRMRVNGLTVAEAEVSDWPSGDVGLVAGSYEAGGVEVWFDHFTVRQARAAGSP
jgi:hypothetical protein